MEPAFTIRLLGGLAIQRAGHELIRLHTSKQGLLLALLALNLRADINKEVLIERLWTDSCVESAQHSLSQLLNLLKSQFVRLGIDPGLALQSDRSCLRLNPTTFSTDILRIRAAAAKARLTASASERLEYMRFAVRLYGGELLPGWYDDWVIEERERLTAGYLAHLSRLIAELKLQHLPDEALEHALRAAEIAADSDSAHEEVLRLYIELGRSRDAHQHFEKYRDWKSHERLSAPGQSLLELIGRSKSILCRDAATDGGAGLQTADAPSITHNSASQLQACSPHPPAPSPINGRRGNVSLFSEHAYLPINGSKEGFRPVAAARYLDRFYGREHEIEQITNRLPASIGSGEDSPGMAGARLVTITGPEGWGKTRLAIEAANRICTMFGWRIEFVSLSRGARSDSVTHAIAVALHAWGIEGPVDSLILDNLTGVPCLLILDDCGCMPVIHRVVKRLLAAVPGLCIAATAASSLGVEGEHTISLRPLDSPHSVSSITTLQTFPGVRMFVSRAQAVCPDFQLSDDNARAISEIVERLEGIPFAIELAAEQTRALSLAQILAALKDRLDFPAYLGIRKHHPGSLRETIERSYGQLDSEAKQLFCVLSVFDSGCTLDVLKAVCAIPDPLPIIDRLVERSLIEARPGPGDDVMHYWMLDCFREYGRAKAGIVGGGKGERG